MNGLDINKLPERMTPKMVANYFRITSSTLIKWEKNNWFLVKPTKINSRGDRRYNKEDIINFLNK